jgi:hypothetical protein
VSSSSSYLRAQASITIMVLKNWQVFAKSKHDKEPNKSQPIYIHWSWSLHNNNPLCGWLTIYMKPCKKGIFTIRKPLFDHRTQGLYFCHLPNIKSKWDKFKWEILDSSNYDHFHGDDDFSHAYVITHKHFKVKIKKCKNWVHNLLYTT